MKIGVDINPTIDQIVGKGLFLKNILQVLSSIDKKNEYFLYGIEQPNFELGENFTFTQIPGKVKFSWDLRCFRKAVFKHKVNVFLTVKSLYSAILHPRVILGIHDLGIVKIPDAYPEETVKKYRRLLPIALKRTQKIITPSAATKSHIMHSFKIPAKKIVKIPHAVPDWTKNKVENEDIKRVVNKYNLPQSFFLFAGTLEPRKNLIKLVEAFSQFKKDDKEEYKLVIIGKKGYQYEKISKRVIDLEITQDIIFTGYIAEFDLKPIYLLAYAFVFPSLLEGFGLSPLEAMACGLPVICSKKGAIGEVAGNVCLEIDPKETGSIVKAMKRIVKDKELHEKLVTEGQRRSKQFKWKKSAKKLLKLFEEVATKESK